MAVVTARVMAPLLGAAILPMLYRQARAAGSVVPPNNTSALSVIEMAEWCSRVGGRDHQSVGKQMSIKTQHRAHIKITYQRTPLVCQCARRQPWITLQEEETR
jgi:hypothetical protein